jgi:hypothetical protein
LLPNIRVKKSKRARSVRLLYAWDKKEVQWVLEGKREGRTAFGRTRCGWKENVKMDLKEAGW